ncbi:MAG: hypothetical protein EZS28_024746, partial [Streblomastix strix]
ICIYLSPTFQSSFQSQSSEQSNQQYNQLPAIKPPTLVQQQQILVCERVYVNGRLLDSLGTALTGRIAQDQQPLQNKKISQRTDQNLFTPACPPELSINMNQQQFNAHRGFWAQRSYTLRYLDLDEDDNHRHNLDHDHNHDRNHIYDRELKTGTINQIL